MRFVVRLILYVEKTTDEVKNHVIGEKFADVLLQRLNCLRCRLNEPSRLLPMKTATIQSGIT